MATEKKPKIEKKPKLIPPKLGKKNLFKMVIGAIPAVVTKWKKSKKTFKDKQTDFVKQQKDEATTLKDKAATLSTQATKNFDDLTDAQKKVWNSLDGKGWSTAKKIKYILGGGAALTAAGGATKFGYDVHKEMQKAKGGYVKMKKGGSVKKSSYKKSRGTGAAKRGTKFKGVF